MKITLIGVGVMGTGIASNLLQAGRALTIYDIEEDRLAALVRAGAHAVTSVAAAAIKADVVMLSLPNATLVQEIAEEALSHMRAGTVLIDLSTSPPSMARSLAERASQSDIAFLDAPWRRGRAQGLAFVLAPDFGACM